MKLHNYYRSSASYRVRIALHLKGLPFDYIPVHLTRDGGEQFGADFRTVNPQSLVPVLEDGGHFLTQSLAILEYLDETRPLPALLPREPAERARVRSLAQLVACDIHPLNNLRVLRYLKDQLGISEEAKDGWYHHWVHSGLSALEALLSRDRATGLFCHGDSPGLADCCLVPQLYNARRLSCDLTGFPTLLRIEAACQELPAFAQAAPAAQPDSPPGG